MLPTNASKNRRDFGNATSWEATSSRVLPDDSFNSLDAVNEMLAGWKSDREDSGLGSIMEIDKQLDFSPDNFFGNEIAPSPPEPMEIDWKENDTLVLTTPPVTTQDFLTDNDKRYKEASHKLAESMQRSHETRPSLSLAKIQLPPTAWRERHKSIVYVLSNVEQSSEQLQASLLYPNASKSREKAPSEYSSPCRA